MLEAMKLSNRKLAVGSGLVAALATGSLLFSATAPVLGVAVSNGSLLINNARVEGNATLMSGNTVATERASSRLRLTNKGQIVLASASQSTLYRDRAVLSKGSGQFDVMAPYSVQAGAFSVGGTTSSSSFRVDMKDSGKVQVTAFNSPVHVFNGAGVLVGNVAAGSALAFEMQDSGAMAGSSMTGCVAQVGVAYMVRDETSGATVELRGSSIPANLGHRVQLMGAPVTGATPPEGATQVIQVNSVKSLSTGCTSPIPGAVAGGAVAAGGAAGGIAAGAGGAAAAGAGAVTTTAIVAGVVVVGAAAATTGVIVSNNTTNNTAISAGR